MPKGKTDKDTRKCNLFSLGHKMYAEYVFHGKTVWQIQTRVKKKVK